MSTVRTILFVENDPVALQMYRSRLEREGFHLEAALDGLDALKVLAQITPDLVVLDMFLPRLPGADVLKFMRADLRLKSIPVVVFSNATLTDLPQGLEKSGPTRHLLKSDCTFPMLLQCINDSLTAAAMAQGAAGESAPPPPMSPPPPLPTEAITGAETTNASEFLRQALAEVPRIREHCFAYIKAPASPASLQHLPNLYQRVHFLSAGATKAGCARVALLTSAFDTMLSEIMVKPSWVTPSVLQTIAQAVDCLGILLKSNEADLAQPMPQAKVLAVDDDAVCNHVMVTTLKRAKFDAKSVDDPLVALQLLETNQYDLVLLDINMPDLTGFELCERLRRFPHCKTTPVIFITGHNNFDNRKQSVLSGGHDFITKPVSPSELALKATIHLLKGRVQRVPAGAIPNTASLRKPAPPQANPVPQVAPAPAVSAAPAVPAAPPTAPAFNQPAFTQQPVFTAPVAPVPPPVPFTPQPAAAMPPATPVFTQPVFEPQPVFTPPVAPVPPPVPVTPQPAAVASPAAPVFTQPVFEPQSVFTPPVAPVPPPTPVEPQPAAAAPPAAPVFTQPVFEPQPVFTPPVAPVPPPAPVEPQPAAFVPPAAPVFAQPVFEPQPVFAPPVAPVPPPASVEPQPELTIRFSPTATAPTEATPTIENLVPQAPPVSDPVPAVVAPPQAPPTNPTPVESIAITFAPAPSPEPFQPAPASPQVSGFEMTPAIPQITAPEPTVTPVEPPQVAVQPTAFAPVPEPQETAPAAEQPITIQIASKPSQPDDIFSPVPAPGAMTEPIAFVPPAAASQFTQPEAPVAAPIEPVAQPPQAVEFQAPPAPTATEQPIAAAQSEVAPSPVETVIAPPFVQESIIPMSPELEPPVQEPTPASQVPEPSPVVVDPVQPAPETLPAAEIPQLPSAPFIESQPPLSDAAAGEAQPALETSIQQAPTVTEPAVAEPQSVVPALDSAFTATTQPQQSAVSTEPQPEPALIAVPETPIAAPITMQAETPIPAEVSITAESPAAAQPPVVAESPAAPAEPAVAATEPAVVPMEAPIVAVEPSLPESQVPPSTNGSVDQASTTFDPAPLDIPAQPLQAESVPVECLIPEPIATAQTPEAPAEPQCETQDRSSAPELDIVTSATETGTSHSSEELGSVAMVPNPAANFRPASQQAAQVRVDADLDRRFERMTEVVAGIMFGEDSLTEMNLRLVRAALERYDVRGLLRGSSVPEQPSANGVHDLAQDRAEFEASWDDTL